MTTFHIEKMYAQSENVGIGTTTPDNSAVLHITFSNPVNPKGILIPKLTTTERNSITSPANGLIIFNTTTNAIEYNSGTSGTPAWSVLFSSGNLTLADGHIFVGNGSNQATAVSPTGDVTISNTGVTTIANNAVTSAKIADGTIVEGDLADGAVTSAKILDGTIAATDIATSAVTTTQILDGTIAAADIATDAVTSAKIQADAVTSAKISDGTIVAADIATDAVNGTKISLTSEANGSMMYFNGTDWVNLAAGTNGQVLKLTGGIPAWTADNSLSSTLNNGQIFVGNISNIATGVTPSGDFTITNAGVATISNNAVTEAKLADNSVNTAELIDGSVTNSKMAANSVNTSEIIDGAVNSGDLADNSVITTKINDGAVTSAKIAEGTIVAGDLAEGAVTSAKILDGTIATGDLANNAVDGTKITINAESNGSMMYYNNSSQNWENLAIGTNGQQLKVTGGVPTWATDNSLSTTLNNGQIFVGNISNIATGVTPSGDFTITNAGVATISNNAVTEAKLADNSVNTAELIDGSVTNSKMAANSVNTSEIIDGAVNSGDLADNSVITTKINDEAVTSAKIADGTIATGDIADGAVTGAKLENSGVTASTYGSATQVPVVTVDAKGRVTGVTNTTITGTSPIGSALTSGNIIVGSGTNVAAAVSMSGDVTISNTGVTTIANDAITNAKLADNAVNTAEITDGAVSSAKILDGTIATGDIADGAVTGAKLENSGVTANTYGSATQVPVVTVDAKGRVTGVTNTTITGTSPIGSALTSGNIIVGSGTNVAAAVSMSGDVTISNTGVTTIANDAITNTKMADNSVGNAELLDNAVNTAEIVNGAVTDVKLADNSVITAKINDGAVTGAKLENSGVTASTYGSATQVPVVTVDAKGRVTGVTNTTITGTSPIGSALTSGNIIVGSGTNVAAAVSMSGDVTISNTGVTTIVNDAITNAKLADNSVGNAELLDNAVNTAEIVNGAVTDVKLADNSVITAKINDGAVTGAKLENSGVTANTYGSATQVPVVTVDAKGRVTGVTNTTITGTSPIGSSLTSGNIIVGSGTNVAAAVSMSGDVTISNTGATTIQTDAVTSGKILDGAVATAELANDAVTSAKIADGTIVAGDLADGAVTSLKILDGTITTGDIADGAVTGAKLENSGVTANTYGSATQVPVVTVDAKGRVTGVTNTTITGTSPIGSSLTSGNIIVGSGTNVAAAVPMSGDVTISNTGATTIADNAVTNAKLADNAVGNAELADNAVNTSEIANGAVTDVKLADNSVVTAKIADGAVTGAKLENSGVTANTYGSATQVPVVTVDAKGRVTGVTNTTITGTSPIGSSLTSGNIIVGSGTNVAAAVSMSGDVTITNTGATTIADNAVTNAKLADNAVNTAEIANDAVTSAKIAFGTIEAGDIADGAITTAKILNGTIVEGDIADGAIATAKILDGTIATSDLADNAVTNAKLADNAVNTAEIANDAVTSAKIAFGTIEAGDIADGAITTAKILNGTISDVDISATAEIDVTKLGNGTNNQLIRTNGTNVEWFTPTYLESAAALGGDLSGTIDNAQIVINAVTSNEIADNAVGNSELTDNAVNTAEIVDLAVTTAKIADNNVTTAKIADDAITDAKIADNAVLRINITDDAINSAKIENGTILNEDIADNTITNAKLAGSIDPNKITLANANIIVGNGGSGSAVPLSGDASITNTGAITVSRIQGIDVSTTDPTSNQVLAYNNTNSRWEPKTLGIERKSRVRAYLNTSQTINNATVTKVAFDAESFDSSNEFNTTNNNFVAPVDGYYMVSARIRFIVGTISQSDKFINAAIFLNGTIYSNGNRLTIRDGGQTHLDNEGLVISDIVFATAGQTIDIRVEHNSNVTPSSLNLQTGSAETYVSIHLLSE